MRNPILPSPDRPIPLPDCILLDTWWADLRADTAPAPPPARATISQKAASDRRETFQVVAARRQ